MTIRLIASKEMLVHLRNPRLIILAIASFLLITISLGNGYLAYQEEQRLDTIGHQNAESSLKQLPYYSALKIWTKTLTRPPEILAIFDIGVTGAMGRFSMINAEDIIMRPLDSRIGSNPVLALFSELDLTFVTSIFLSFLALLLSYSAISGERENGTLKLMLSNGVSRTSIIAGKFFGSLMIVISVFLVPFLFALVILTMATDITFSPAEWLRLTLIVLAHALYLAVIVCAGLAISALTRNTLNSFLGCLLFWIIFIAVAPPASMELASLLSPVPQRAEQFAHLDIEQDNLSEHLPERLSNYLDTHPMTEAEFREREGEIIQELETEIYYEEFAYKVGLFSEYRNRREEYVNKISTFSFASPAASFKLASQMLAGTGPRLLYRFEESLEHHREDYAQFAASKAESHKEHDKNIKKGRATVGPDGYMRYPATVLSLDISGLPRFTLLEKSVNESISEALPFLCALVIQALLFFTIAYVSFLRYDVR